MTGGKKLALLGLLIVGVTGWFVWQGAAGSWQYYLTADECLDGGTSLQESRLRVSGKVAAGSLQAAPDRTSATFSLQGTDRLLPVACSGPLPDNLAENIEVVVEGRLDDSGLLRGDKVLTRCASKYQRKGASHEVAERPQRAAEGVR